MIKKKRRRSGTNQNGSSSGPPPPLIGASLHRGARPFGRALRDELAVERLEPLHGGLQRPGSPQLDAALARSRQAIWGIEQVVEAAREVVRIARSFFSRRGRHPSSLRDWSSDVCSSDLASTHGSASPSAIFCLKRRMKRSASSGA